jgi:ribosomal protein S18 acetylase RimI-like enzyme
LKNFAENSKDEYFLDYKNGNKKTKKSVLKDMKIHYTEIFENSIYDNNMTLLVARDKRNKIQGACLSASCEELPGCFDTTLWIDALAVNKKYRREGIGEKLIKTILEAEKKSYTDAFLTASNYASKFYEKLGFKKLTFHKKTQRTVLKYLENTREDFPEHVKAYFLALQPDKPRWYIKAAKAVKQETNFK